MNRQQAWTEYYNEALTEKKLMNYLLAISNSKEFQDRVCKMSLTELGEMYGCTEQEMIKLINIEKEKQDEKSNLLYC